MSNIKILDCTLRDGGYVNNWQFGEKIIKGVVKDLSAASIDIIEIGFLTDLPHTSNHSLFNSTNELLPLTKLKGNSLVAGMIALGEKEMDPNVLDNSNSTGVDIVRLTFHNSDSEVKRAIDFANILITKGYKVCIQPVGTTTYSDDELTKLIEKINDLNPYAFYLVDTLGTLYEDKLMHFINLIDKSLNSNIKIGFHSHNNLQMSFANSQKIVSIESKRNYIIDSSLYGMGRGAGNLCTELITRYLNETGKGNYNLVPILDAIDNFIYPISLKLPWGYNAHYYMSAIYGCHPNYASYLMNLQTLTMNEVNTILQSLPENTRHLFDKKLIAKLYLDFQNETKHKVQALDKKFINREVLLIAPGYNATKFVAEINDYINKNHPVVFSINFLPQNIAVDYLFISNRKRFADTNFNDINSQIIATSNIPCDNENVIYVDYDSLCDSRFNQPDNAGIMALRLMTKLKIKKAVLAGFDGFNTNDKQNYYDSTISDHNTKQVADEKNADYANQLSEILNKLSIDFLTPSIYKKIIDKANI